MTLGPSGISQKPRGHPLPWYILLFVYSNSGLRSGIGLASQLCIRRLYHTVRLVVQSSTNRTLDRLGIVTSENCVISSLLEIGGWIREEFSSVGWAPCLVLVRILLSVNKSSSLLGILLVSSRRSRGRIASAGRVPGRESFWNAEKSSTESLCCRHFPRTLASFCGPNLFISQYISRT